MTKNKQIKLTFLGTGTSFGVPVVGCPCEICQSENWKDKRLRTSAKVQIGDTVIVLDTGPDFRQQMLNSYTLHIDGILYTHEHKDHIAGIDDVRVYNWLMKKPMQMYAEPRVLEAIKREVPYVFSEIRYPGIPRIDLHSIDGDPFMVKDVEVIPIRMYHHKLPVYGFRFGNFAYLTDFNSIPDESFALLEGVEYVVVEALQHEKHISHLSLPEALELIEKIQPKKAWLTHINHNLGLHDELNQTLPSGVQLAHDGLVEIIDDAYETE